MQRWFGSHAGVAASVAANTPTAASWHANRDEPTASTNRHTDGPEPPGDLPAPPETRPLGQALFWRWHAQHGFVSQYALKIATGERARDMGEPQLTPLQLSDLWDALPTEPPRAPAGPLTLAVELAAAQAQPRPPDDWTTGETCGTRVLTLCAVPFESGATCLDQCELLPGHYGLCWCTRHRPKIWPMGSTVYCPRVEQQRAQQEDVTRQNGMAHVRAAAHASTGDDAPEPGQEPDPGPQPGVAEPAQEPRTWLEFIPPPQSMWPACTDDEPADALLRWILPALPAPLAYLPVVCL